MIVGGGGGSGHLGSHRSLRSFRQSQGAVTVQVPDCGPGPWQGKYKELTFSRGAVFVRESSDPADAGLSGTIVLSSHLRGAPAPARPTTRRSGAAVHDELARNIDAAKRAGTSSWVVVTLMCPVEPAPDGSPPMISLRTLLGLEPGDKVFQLALYAWRDRNPIVPCDVTKVNNDAQRYRFAETKKRHSKDEAARPEHTVSEAHPLTQAGQVRRDAMAEGLRGAGADQHLSRVIQGRGISSKSDAPRAPNKAIAPCASCHPSDLTAADGAKSTGFLLAEDMLSDTDAHRKWMIKREPENVKIKRMQQQLAGDAPVAVSGPPVATSPSLLPGSDAGARDERGASPHTPAARAQGSGASPIATPDAMTAWVSELALLVSERDAASTALTRALAAQDKADSLRALANRALMSPAELASKDGAYRRAGDVVRDAEAAEEAAAAAVARLSNRGPVEPTSSADAPNLGDPLPMPPLFE